MSAFTSLESVTEPTVGESRQLNKTTAHHTMIVTVEGTPTNVVVYMEISHDNVRWIRTNQFQSNQSGLVTTIATGNLAAFVRANLTTLTGGTDPHVSVSVASEDDI